MSLVLILTVIGFSTIYFVGFSRKIRVWLAEEHNRKLRLAVEDLTASLTEIDHIKDSNQQDPENHNQGSSSSSPPATLKKTTKVKSRQQQSQSQPSSSSATEPDSDTETIVTLGVKVALLRKFCRELAKNRHQSNKHIHFFIRLVDLVENESVDNILKMLKSGNDLFEDFEITQCETTATTTHDQQPSLISSSSPSPEEGATAATSPYIETEKTEEEKEEEEEESYAEPKEDLVLFLDVCSCEECI